MNHKRNEKIRKHTEKRFTDPMLQSQFKNSLKMNSSNLFLYVRTFSSATNYIYSLGICKTPKIVNKNVLFKNPLVNQLDVKRNRMGEFNAQEIVLNDSFLYTCNSTEEKANKKNVQEMFFKNKKTKLALRRKRKRMGERVSLRYR